MVLIDQWKTSGGVTGALLRADLVPFSRTNRPIKTEVQVMRRDGGGGCGGAWRPPHRLDPFLVPTAEWAAAASVNLGDAAMLIKARRTNAFQIRLPPLTEFESLFCYAYWSMEIH